ncbi:hypothetical protein SASPL_106215 [Salvia splendens]|uniref:C2 domain-containing protein n=1 Tax=Salvia splendens TaxID=180675 RepID=A0A8X9AA18_SALSN|nr:hypothetical protein SASPL_106215 [Salvia splendens]
MPAISRSFTRPRLVLRSTLAAENCSKAQSLTTSAYDLVEQMQYLYVRVVKARELAAAYTAGEAVAEVKLGNYKGITKRVSYSTNPEWNQVFAFSRDCVQSSAAEVFVKEGNQKDEFLGRVWFDLSEVPKRVPPDSELAPQWYRMEDKKGEKVRSGEVMCWRRLHQIREKIYENQSLPSIGDLESM